MLALRALGLGDLLAGVPALRALRRARPDDRLTLLTPSWLESLARHAVAVDEVVHTDGLDRPLPPATHGADLAVNLHGRGPQSTALLRAAGAGRIVAFDDRPDGPRWADDEHERFRWCRLMVESEVATEAQADPADLHIAAPDVAIPPGAVGATIVHPGASAASRRWPAARWAAVAAAEAAAGHRVLVTGSANERLLASEVARMAGLDACDVVAGRTDPLALVALVAAARRVVCGDTGVAHVASAVGTPSVVLFGPVPPSRWGPPEDDRHVALWRGSTGDPHARAPDLGLLAIEVDEVLQAIDDLDLRAVATGNR